MAKFLIGHSFEDAGSIEFTPDGEMNAEPRPGQEDYFKYMVDLLVREHGHRLEAWLDHHVGLRRRGEGLWVCGFDGDQEDWKRRWEYDGPDELPPQKPRGSGDKGLSPERNARTWGEVVRSR